MSVEMTAEDWRTIVDRATAVAVGAGAPDDGATLPEQVEWLAEKLHGPTLRPGGGIAGADDDGRIPILWRCRQEFADGTMGWRYWGELPGVPVWMPAGGELTIRIDHRGASEPLARCETSWIS